tara:strand:+ start:54 stop:356 length:303 start_codon:yes stop_codon:yes gene_type:complete
MSDISTVVGDIVLKHGRINVDGANPRHAFGAENNPGRVFLELVEQLGTGVRYDVLAEQTGLTSSAVRSTVRHIRIMIGESATHALEYTNDLTGRLKLYKI